MTNLLQHVRFSGRAPLTSGSRPQGYCLLSLEERPAKCHEAAHAGLDDDQRELVECVFRLAGLDPAAYSTAPLVRRLPAVLRALRCADAATARLAVERSPQCAGRALNALLIGHTLAFRDAPVFELLRAQVLPQLRAGARIWSMGCSRGFELLSVALLLEECGLEAAVLRGSDCRRLDPAGDRLLARDFAASLPPEFAGQASRISQGWIDAQLRAIEWRCEDITAEGDAGSWDLILCRNVGIYLAPVAAARMWRKIVRSLGPGGFLVTGKAERPLAVGPLHRLGPCIYQSSRDASR